MIILGLVVLASALLIGGAAMYWSWRRRGQLPPAPDDWWRDFEREFRAYTRRVRPTMAPEGKRTRDDR